MSHWFLRRKAFFKYMHMLAANNWVVSKQKAKFLFCGWMINEVTTAQFLYVLKFRPSLLSSNLQEQTHFPKKHSYSNNRPGNIELFSAGAIYSCIFESFSFPLSSRYFLWCISMQNWLRSEKHKVRRCLIKDLRSRKNMATLHILGKLWYRIFST